MDDELRRLDLSSREDPDAWDRLKAARSRVGLCPTCGGPRPCQACVVFDLQAALVTRGYRIMEYGTDGDYGAVAAGAFDVWVQRDAEKITGRRWNVDQEVESALPYSEAELDAFLASLEAIPGRRARREDGR